MKNYLKVLTICLLSFGQYSLAGELDGAWELVSGEYLDGQGNIVKYENSGMKSIKVISDGHFSFTSMKGSEFWASGTGTYRKSEDEYTEKLLHNSFGEKPGAVFSFKTRVEGDYWYNSRWKDGARVEYEVWRRVKAEG